MKERLPKSMEAFVMNMVHALCQPRLREENHGHSKIPLAHRPMGPRAQAVRSGATEKAIGVGP